MRHHWLSVPVVVLGGTISGRLPRDKQQSGCIVILSGKDNTIAGHQREFGFIRSKNVMLKKTVGCRGTREKLQ